MIDPRELILGPQAALTSSWYDTTQVERGKFHGRNYPATPPTGAELDAYIGNNYYDQSLCHAISHKRSSDPEFLTLARKVADSWWLGPHIGAGTVRTFDTFSHTPRNASLGGLILRALDGRLELWDWINAYTRYQFDNWLKRRVNDPQLYLGVRDGAFMLLYAAWLAVALPDSFPLQSGGTATNGAALRAQYLADVEAITVNYFGRLQRDDGSWRWDDPYSVQADDGTLVGIMQPFQVGLLLHALINVYEITTNSSVKFSIQNQVVRACRHLYSGGPYSTQFIPVFGVRLRGFHYFYHGGTTVNPTKYEKGDLPADFADWNPAWDVQNQRQPIGLLVAAYGWCFKQTGDSYFKQTGDELWDSAYGPTDGIHNYMAGDAKSYNQNCRWAGQYLVWAGAPAVPEPIPQPIPLPEPTPTTPTPLPSQPSPDGTKGTIVVDAQGGAWTLEPGTKRTLRDGKNMGGGQGTEYKYLSAVVYVHGLDDNWYVWRNSSWASVGSEPGVAQPTPTPIPEPAPVPVPEPPKPCTMTTSGDITLPRNGTATVTVTLENIPGGFAELRAVASNGQVSVSPGLKRLSGTSASAQFLVGGKVRGGSITFSGPCGSKVVNVRIG